jgi:Ni,Fe-hydrogenase III large subunit
MSSLPAAFAKITAGKSVGLDELPVLDGQGLAFAMRDAIREGSRVVSYFGIPKEEGLTELIAVMAGDTTNALGAARALVKDGFPSIARDCPQVQLFEREIAEQCGIGPEGHPWFKPVRYRRSWTGRDAWGRDAESPILPGVGDFYRVEGEEVHEVAVGPVHAGIIEPGHFRFQCHGEEVFHLEIALGYQHRGVEESLRGGPDRRSIRIIETVAGDTTIGHSTAYCQALEGLAGAKRSPRSDTIRAIALEFERLANHTGDLGAIAGDTGYLPTSSYCGRIRGDFLNMTAVLAGNRFGRGLLRTGGVAFDIGDEERSDLLKRLAAAESDVTNAIALMWNSSSVMARLEDTGRLTKDEAVELGLVGPPARATGLPRDVRRDHPSGIYRFAQIPVATFDSGDVYARANVRWLELSRSIAFIRDRLAALPAGALSSPMGPLASRSLVVALAEGWRGEICHVAVTDDEGKFERYKIVDPSFHNWAGLAMALRGQEISDFPLCNKSFNLSYCGHDL